ncbi:hypothetical protein, unlikely [Trypanosoma brucei gambiense DAL972]|uniref:Uncharacterized protein n=1 Tax=Trypanosoma brucei gambiense (strain MHOM/CI/86/DAL972) TaxID=679716 RepID=C9ZNF4_TRYB9|nr:hypothetical protein, unlikely [Trypanosoma brucei gambiense DAL972]CBH10932.1 hypothetical protein, unlikely [Trypanosoma brucei gambiense DAL972]|eukprot:XP_011773219.1 hypothetical protein, unlikely [Trypanosoma brucei gambiense DAL972]
MPYFPGDLSCGFSEKFSSCRALSDPCRCVSSTAHPVGTVGRRKGQFNLFPFFALHRFLRQVSFSLLKNRLGGYPRHVAACVPIVIAFVQTFYHRYMAAVVPSVRCLCFAPCLGCFPCSFPFPLMRFYR